MGKKLDQYLEAIRQGSKKIGSVERNKLEGELENLALRLTFNGTVARLVRIKDGKSVQDIADTLGCSYGIINHYETGVKTPSPTTKVGKGYLCYLSSKGYEPVEKVIPSMED